MSKKKRNAHQKLSHSRVGGLPSEESNLPTGESTTGKSGSTWWSNLGGFERLAIVGLGLFLVVGALGSTGLGGKVIGVFSSDDSNSGQTGKQGFLTELNTLTPTPTPLQLSKEYIYAGNRLLAAEDANASAAPPADLAVWRASSGYWYVMGLAQQQWGSGSSNDKPVPGDYDGDGKTDFCVFRPGAGTWFVIKSSSGSANTQEYYNFGTNGDLPKAADFDGDGKTDAVLYRPSNGTWYIRQSTTGNVVSQQFGLNGDVPVPADYDGDGKADIAVFRDGTTPYFYSLRSSDGQFQSAQFGLSGDAPQPADYDGDGKADYAVWRPSNGNWHINQSSNNTTVSYQWGNYGQDTAVPNDYDADGKVDVAVWRGNSSNPNEVGSWYIRNSSTGQMRVDNWGQTGDEPVPFFYRR